MSKWKKRAIELITGLAFTGKANPSVIPYVPSKTEISGIETKHFNRTSPERRGISSKRIYDMLTELEESRRANLHNIMILKDGEVISECSHPGYDVNIRHLSHSMSKTLTGMAIGFLVDEGRLDVSARICDIFPEMQIKDKRFMNITIKHLLSMTSGVPFSEVGSVTENEWTRAFFESRLDFAPGTKFAYNSMNSYILGRVVVRKTGISLSEYLDKKLFSPLGIENYFWEIGPEGIEKGGWGMFMSAESWAKVGVMMLNMGVFEGKRILSKRWVAESISTHGIAHESAGDFNYGYQLWVNRENDEFLFNGMLGQNVWICPKNNIVVVVNSENNELFQNSAVIEIIQKYLGGDVRDEVADGGISLSELRKKEKNFFMSRHWVRPKEEKKGILYRLGFKSRAPFDTAWEPILGTYSFAKNNHGILPLFIRAMQNNYSGGIESFSFVREGESLFFISEEGSVEYKIEIGLYDFKTTVVNFDGEKYIVRAMGEAMEDEDRNMIYKIELLLPEMPNSRKIKLSLSEDGKLVVRMTEIPNHKIAEPLVDAIYTTNPKFAFAVGMLEKRLGDKFIVRKLESLFSPTFVGVNVLSRDYSRQLEGEKIKAEAETSGAKSIASLLLKLTKE